MFTFSPVRVAPEMLKRYEELFLACFSRSPKFSPEVLRWMYADNPAGQAVGFDAFDGERLIAHFVTLPFSASFEGREVKALLALNIATHPDYQGKGLFTKLAEMTCQAGAEQGFHSIYGVANTASTPGYVKRLGFQLVQPLEARIGFGPLDVDLDLAASLASFSRIWTPQSLAWRCANPVNPVFMAKGRNGGAVLHAQAVSDLVSAYAELPADAVVPADIEAKGVAPVRVFLGLVPAGVCAFRSYVPIPQRLRPSPLNMIFRSLTTSGQKIKPDSMLFSFLDFDAY